MNNRYFAIKCKDFKELKMIDNYFLKIGYNWNINLNDDRFENYFEVTKQYYLLIDKKLKSIDAINSLYNRDFYKILDSKVIKRQIKINKINE